jgi:hypothetical protein
MPLFEPRIRTLVPCLPAYLPTYSFMGLLPGHLATFSCSRLFRGGLFTCVNIGNHHNPLHQSRKMSSCCSMVVCPLLALDRERCRQLTWSWASLTRHRDLMMKTEHPEAGGNIKARCFPLWESLWMRCRAERYPTGRVGRRAQLSKQTMAIAVRLGKWNRRRGSQNGVLMPGSFVATSNLSEK